MSPDTATAPALEPDLALVNTAETDLVHQRKPWFN